MPDNKPKTNEIGASGTLIFSGLISQEEYNRKLTGAQGIKVYDEMRRSDATVKASLKVCKLPIQSTEWRIDPASDSEEDQKTAEFIDQILLKGMTQPFDDFLRQALTMYDFGFSVFEIVYNKVTIEGKDYIGVEKLAFRKQSTVYAWETSDHQPGITQLIGDGSTYSIPLERLLIFTNEQEGDNYEGISLLRAAYKHWYMKDVLYKIDALAFERQGLGVLTFTAPPDASEQDRAKARVYARNQRANEQGYLEAPEGFKFEYLDMKAGATRDPEASISHHDRQILVNVLAQFLTIGSKSSSGSFSVGEDQRELLMQSLEETAKNIASTLTKVVKFLVDLNFPGKAYPTVAFESLSSQDLAMMSDAISKLLTAGAITAEPKLEEYLRATMNLPEITAEEIAQIQADKQQQEADKMQQQLDAKMQNEPPKKVQASEKNPLLDLYEARDRILSLL